MTKLSKFVNEICAEIRNISPAIRIEISYEPFEDVDATIRVYPPNEEIGDKVNEMAVERTLDILLEEGYHISVLVFEPEEVKIS